MALKSCLAMASIVTGVKGEGKGLKGGVKRKEEEKLKKREKTMFF